MSDEVLEFDPMQNLPTLEEFPAPDEGPRPEPVAAEEEDLSNTCRDCGRKRAKSRTGRDRDYDATHLHSDGPNGWLTEPNNKPGICGDCLDIRLNPAPPGDEGAN